MTSEIIEFVMDVVSGCKHLKRIEINGAGTIAQENNQPLAILESKRGLEPSV